ncbi:MAG: ATP-binding cassette domain-containing protein [Erysipelotrichaceae bacterium]
MSFHLKKGKCLALLGENGGGKTTTFRLILGLLQPDSGSITFENEDIGLNSINKIGYLPEERSLFKDITVKQQLTFLARLKKVDKKDIEKRINTLADLLHVNEYINQKIMELSKGNQQKIQLMCALIHDPKLLILDEPFTGLDVENVDLFINIFNQLLTQGKSIIFSSHQYDYIDKICDDVIYVKQAKVVLADSLNNLREKYGYLQITFNSNYIPSFIINENIDKLDENKYLISIKERDRAIRIYEHLLENQNVENIYINETSFKNIIQQAMEK